MTSAPKWILPLEISMDPQIPPASSNESTYILTPLVQDGTSGLQEVSGAPLSPDRPVGFACPSKMLVMAYYPDWIASDFPPNKTDFSRFDWIDFAFAVPNSNFDLEWDEPKRAPTLLKALVHSAHAQGAKVKLSIGGWTGSK
jgi:chitinase